ncbi:hypothetical protein Trydic_g21416 [Trypoxylus dichotomus]
MDYEIGFEFRVDGTRVGDIPSAPCIKYTVIQNDKAALNVTFILDEHTLTAFGVEGEFSRSHCGPLSLMNFCMKFIKYAWKPDMSYFCPAIDLKVGFITVKSILMGCFEHQQNNIKVSRKNPFCGSPKSGATVL